MKNIISLIAAAFLFSACEKVIDLDYQGNQSRIVIEGSVTDAQGPYFVKITKSVGLSSSGAFPVVDNALVTLSDDAGNSEVLSPQGGGVYRSALTQGKEGRTYTLTVKADNQVYIAQSTMPLKVALEEVSIQSAVVIGETEHQLIPLYHDPVEKGNSYRFVLTVNNKLVNQHLIQNDDIKNGGVNTARLEINDNDLKLKSGDEVEVTMECVDKPTAFYYNTLFLMVDSGPGGSITPNNPPNNISNGALGIFSAHTVETKRIRIP